MVFTLVDVVLILILFSFIATGFFLGLIRSIGALVGLVAGTWVAGHYFYLFSEWLNPIFWGRETTARIVSFFIIFIIVNRLTVILFHFIDKAFSLLAFIPFMKTINRFGGVILGTAEGILTVGIAIYVIAKLMPESVLVTQSLDNSQIAHYLVAISEFLTALLPGAFAKIKSVF
jgi:uncharacterized membrane protein required for colicin V production